MTYINRGRDVHALIEKEGDLGVRKAVVKLAEDNAVLHQEIKAMHKVIEKLIGHMMSIGGAVSAQQTAMEKIKDQFYPNNEANPDQKWSK